MTISIDTVIAFGFLFVALVIHYFLTGQWRAIKRHSLDALCELARLQGYQQGFRHALDGSEYDPQIPEDFLEKYYH